MAVIRSPAITEMEVVAAAANRGICDDVIRYIANRREYVKEYTVKQALVGNPKCPLATSLRLLGFLRPDDLKTLARSKNVPGALAAAAKKLLQTRRARVETESKPMPAEPWLPARLGLLVANPAQALTGIFQRKGGGSARYPHSGGAGQRGLPPARADPRLARAGAHFPALGADTDRGCLRCRSAHCDHHCPGLGAGGHRAGRAGSPGSAIALEPGGCLLPPAFRGVGPGQAARPGCRAGLCAGRGRWPGPGGVPGVWVAGLAGVSVWVVRRSGREPPALTGTAPRRAHVVGLGLLGLPALALLLIPSGAQSTTPSAAAWPARPRARFCPRPHRREAWPN